MRVWNRSAEKVHEWVATLPEEAASRVVVASSAADAVPSPDGVVFSILSNDAALNAVVHGPEGILVSLGHGGVHVCLSTVSPETSGEWLIASPSHCNCSRSVPRRLAASQAEAHAARGADYIACPVFGRPPVAVAKKLVAVAGGDAAALARVAPLLSATSQKVVHAGPAPASASTLKLAGNFMLLATIEAQAEAYALAESAGVPRSTAHDLLCGPTGLFATLPVQRIYGEMVASRVFEPVGFTAENGLKDARLVCGAAAAGGLHLPIAELVRERLEAVVAEPGGAARDWAVFAESVKPGPAR